MLFFPVPYRQKAPTTYHLFKHPMTTPPDPIRPAPPAPLRLALEVSAIPKGTVVPGDCRGRQAQNSGGAGVTVLPPSRRDARLDLRPRRAARSLGSRPCLRPSGPGLRGLGLALPVLADPNPLPAAPLTPRHPIPRKMNALRGCSWEGDSGWGQSAHRPGSGSLSHFLFGADARRSLGPRGAVVPSRKAGQPARPLRLAPRWGWRVRRTLAARKQNGPSPRRARALPFCFLSADVLHGGAFAPLHMAQATGPAPRHGRLMAAQDKAGTGPRSFAGSFGAHPRRHRPRKRCGALSTYPRTPEALQQHRGAIFLAFENMSK